MNQDFVAWVGQGTIADRSKELLGNSDRGIALVRRRFFEDMEKVAKGQDPKGIVRDPEVAKRIPLPIATPEVQRDGIPTEQWRQDPYFKRRSTRFPWQYGQPEDVWREYAAAMGIDPAGRDPGETKKL